MIGLRDQIELNQIVLESLIPELSETELRKPRTAAEWASHLRRMHEGIVNWSRRLGELGEDGASSKDLLRWDFDRFKTEVLPAARAYLKTPSDRHEAQAAEMCDDQVIALYLAGCYREMRDDLFKASYLPVREALPQIAAAEKRLQAARGGPLALFAAIQAKQSFLTPMLAPRPSGRDLASDRGPPPPRRGTRRGAARVARSDHRGLRARRSGDRQTIHLPPYRCRRDPPLPSSRPADPRAHVPDQDPA